MNSDEQLRLQVGALARDHREIMGLLEELRGLSELKGALYRLQRLRVLLLTHFSQEQLAGGFYDSVRTRAVADPQEIDSLIGEHRIILSDVKGLIERLERASARDELELVAGLAHLADYIREHERKEQELLRKLSNPSPPDGR